MRSPALLVLASLIACSSSAEDEGEASTSGGSLGSTGMGEESSEASTGSGSSGDESGGEVLLDPPPAGWKRYVVDDQASGPAFTAVGDVNGDARPDLVTGHLGKVMGSTPPPGLITAYLQGETVDTWTRTEIMAFDATVPFPNEATLDDLDGDGDLDAVMPTGFLVCTLFNNPCGALLWFENDGGQWIRHDIVPPGNDLFFHLAVLVDVDGDGITDIVTSGEQFSSEVSIAETGWFKGTDTPERFDTEFLPIGDGGGSLPRVLDVDGDGDQDVATAEFFVEGSTAAWFERIEEPSTENPGGVWTRHAIDTEHGPAIQLSIVDGLRGDDKRYAILSNHTSIHRDEPPSVVVLYEVPTDDSVREPWPFEIISDEIEARPDAGIARNAAPGIFGVGDADGDDDLDVILSGDGDANTYVLEQQGDGSFTTVTFQTGLGQAGSTHIVDLDGDGDTEIVLSGYEADVVLVYEKE